MKKWTFLASLIAFLFTSALCVADTALATPVPTPAVAEIKVVEQPEKVQEELIELREQNKLIREYQESILNTVYWALSAILAMAAALALHNWWTNRKMYETDRAKLQDGVTAKITGLEAMVNLRLEESKGEIMQLVESRIDSTTTRISSEFDGVRNSIESLRQEGESKIDTLRPQLQRLEDLSQQNRSSVHETMWHLRMFESRYWENRGVYSNVLLSQVEAVESALESKDSAVISYALDLLTDAMREKVIPSGTEIHAFTFGQLTKIISLAARSNPEKAKKIEELAKLLKVKSE